MAGISLENMIGRHAPPRLLPEAATPMTRACRRWTGRSRQGPAVIPQSVRVSMRSRPRTSPGQKAALSSLPLGKPCQPHAEDPQLMSQNRVRARGRGVQMAVPRAEFQLTECYPPYFTNMNWPADQKEGEASGLTAKRHGSSWRKRRRM